MRNIFKIAAIFILVVSVATSCEKIDWTYNGPLQVEFAPLSTSSTYTSAFAKTIKQNLYLSSVDTLEIKVQLVGEQQKRDISVEYTIVSDTVKHFPFDSDYYLVPTTAVEGTHFDFVPARSGSQNGVFTIPANSSFGYLKLNSLAGQVAPDVNKKILIQLLPTADIEINPNYQYFTVTITRL